MKGLCMRNADQLLAAALKTQDPTELFQLVQEAVDCIRFVEAREAFTKIRETRLQDQVKRQSAMIENLERTLWKK
jgi:hypothetical protein